MTLRNVAPTVELRPDDRPTGTEKHLGTGFPSGSRRLGPLTSLDGPADQGYGDCGGARWPQRRRPLRPPVTS